MTNRINMRVNYAHSELRSARLSTTFGRELVQLWFGLDNDTIEGLVGRYSRGKRKGELRGEIIWRKTVKGGWKRDIRKGHVELPGSIHDRAIVINHGYPSEEIVLRD